jgi:hypothetical protein
MFRLRLHPTPTGFALGIAIIAFWAVLWLWLIAELASHRSAASAPRAGPPGAELTLRETRPGPAP